MAKRVIEQPATRSDEFLSGRRPLLLSDLTDEERQAAVSAVSAHSMRTRENLQTLAAAGEKPGAPAEIISKGKRARAALESGAENKPYDPEAAIATTMKHFETAASTLSRPTEPIRGGGFYIEHASPIREQAAALDIDPESAFHASSKLSNKNKPGSEKAALTALVQAHHSGTVSMTPEVIGALGSVMKSEPKIDPEHVGKTVPFADLHKDVAAHLSHPDIRGFVQPYTTNVDLEGIAKGGMRTNISQAHEVLRTGEGNDPYKNPKFTSYTAAHVEAPLVGSPEEQEYRIRMSHISDVISGRVPHGQQALDVTGLQGERSGNFSPDAITAIDLHHKRMSYNQPEGAPYAAAGDLGLSAKGDIGKGDTRITPSGIEHAVLQDAVHQTAHRLEQKYSLPFSVPSRLVNEGSWESTRVSTGDSPLNRPAPESRRRLLGAQFSIPEGGTYHPLNYDELNADRAKEGMKPTGPVKAKRGGQGTLF